MSSRIEFRARINSKSVRASARMIVVNDNTRPEMTNQILHHPGEASGTLKPTNGYLSIVKRGKHNLNFHDPELRMNLYLRLEVLAGVKVWETTSKGCVIRSSADIV
jgi:hypothetical protein